MSFYNELSEREDYQQILENPNEELVLSINNVINTKYNLRPYQKCALTIFDWIVRKPQNDEIKDALYEKSLGDFPIYGLEMATGSGKTLMIGALIALLMRQNISKNFLVLTPPRGKSAIYDKTIRNFNLTSMDCVLSNNMKEKYNLITGEDYKNRTINYDDNADFNVMVFNISKFFESDSGIRYVDKPWEESIWKNDKGETISFREYLTQLKDLVIITDEAHHFQKLDGNSSGSIVEKLNPLMLIEFTATMVEKQNPIFRYSISDYITDGYGKQVRAWGINTIHADGLFGYEAGIDSIDCEKIIRGISTHLVKKLALGYDKDIENKKKKPILLIKARDIAHADNICNFIKEQLPLATDVIEKIYNKIVADDYEINNLIKTYVSKEYLIEEISTIGSKTFCFHYKNETPETLTLFNELERNDMEILVQVDKATEGWNIDNVYTILILTSNEGDIKNNVKQLVGRGLRLLREQRIYDDVTDKLKREEEVLHIVCDQGNNFSKFVQEIRDELRFDTDNFTEEIVTKVIQNDINKIFDTSIIDKLKLPKISRNTQLKIESPLALISELSYDNLNIGDFVNKISTDSSKSKNDAQNQNKNKRTLNWDYLFSDIEINLQDLKKTKSDKPTSGEEHLMIIDDRQKSAIVKEIVRSNKILPSHKDVNQALYAVITDLVNRHSFYFKGNMKDESGFVGKFSSKLVQFISKRLDAYLKSNAVIDDYISFKNVFKVHDINIEKGCEIYRPLNTNKIIDLLNNNKKDIPKYQIRGYKKSYFEFSKFDSSQELEFAEILENMNDVELWVKNKNRGQFSVSVGLEKTFSPDFIVKLKNSDAVHIIEIKGGHLLSSSEDKKIVMQEVELKCESCKCHFFIDKDIDKMYIEQPIHFNELQVINTLNSNS